MQTHENKMDYINNILSTSEEPWAPMATEQKKVTYIDMIRKTWCSYHPLRNCAKELIKSTGLERKKPHLPRVIYDEKDDFFTPREVIQLPDPLLGSYLPNLLSAHVDSGDASYPGPLRPFPRPISENDAYTMLSKIAAREPSNAEVMARHRLRFGYEFLNEASDRDLFLARVQDFDVLVFGGMLSRRVHLTYDPDLSKGVAGITLRPEEGSDGRVVIKLHPDLVWFQDEQLPKEFVWGTLLHELIHAFIFILTGSKNTQQAERKLCICGSATAHGKQFKKAAECVARCVGLGGSFKMEDISESACDHRSQLS